METGYPTSGFIVFCTVPHSEEGQEQYINIAFNSIVQRAQNSHIVFLTWYMLWDESPPACESILIGKYCNWGVLREDFSKKPGWYTLKDWFTNKLGG